MTWGIPPYIIGWPGAKACTIAIPARISAFSCASVPASVAGPVPDAMTIGPTLTGWPRSMNGIITSRPVSGKRNGLIGSRNVSTIGRSRSAAAPPATAS